MGKNVGIGRNFEVPDDWIVTTIESNITDIGDGGTPDTNFQRYFGGNIRWAKVDDIEFEISDTKNYLTQEGLDNSSAKLWPEGSVIVTTGATIGKVGISQEPIATKQGITGIVTDHNLDSRYLAYFLISEKETLLRFAQGGTFEEIRPYILKRLRIPLPPLPEQRRIAEILSTVDELIQQTQDIIRESKNLKSGLIQDLIFFENKHGRTQTVQLGPKTADIAESWDVASLGEVTTKVQYGSSKSLSKEGVYPVFRMNNIEDGKMVSSPMKYSMLNEEEAQKYRLEKGDILLNRTNSIDLVGKSGIFDLEGEYIFASYLIRIRTNEKMNPHFLNYYLNSHTGQGNLYSIATRGASQANINATNLQQLNVPVPPLDSQDRIVRQVHSVEEKIEQEQETNQCLKYLQRGLMQDLLTAKVRVPVET